MSALLMAMRYAQTSGPSIKHLARIQDAVRVEDLAQLTVDAEGGGLAVDPARVIASPV
jgi:hypothetical protein